VSGALRLRPVPVTLHVALSAAFLLAARFVRTESYSWPTYGAQLAAFGNFGTIAPIGAGLQLAHPIGIQPAFQRRLSPAVNPRLPKLGRFTTQGWGRTSLQNSVDLESVALCVAWTV